MKNFEQAAAALWDGGWRSEDKEQLQEEHSLTEEEAGAIVQHLESFAADSFLGRRSPVGK